MKFLEFFILKEKLFQRKKKGFQEEFKKIKVII